MAIRIKDGSIPNQQEKVGICMNIFNPPGSSDYWILMCSTSCETCLWLLNSLIAVACVVKVKAKLNSMIFQSLSNLTHFAADNLHQKLFLEKTTETSGLGAFVLLQ